MKFSKLMLAMLVMGVICSLSVLASQPWGSKVFGDIGDFKEYQMTLSEKNDSLCLVAVGDIMLSRYVAQKIKEHDDSSYPFTGVKWLLQNADITFGNLENPITPGREIKIPEMVLRADPSVAPALKDAGFDVLALANNHVPDFGTQGVLDTMNCLDRADILHVGSGRNKEEAFTPRYIGVKGVKIAFLAFNDREVVPDSYLAADNPGTAVLEPEKVTAAIKEAADNSDFTIVSLHAGTEYAPEPDDTQKYFAHLCIDAGADLIVGSHPHVVQKMELYKGRYILYSLGNFIFDQLWSQETREGVVAKIYINKNSVEKIEFIPIFISDDTRPVVLRGQEGQKVLKELGIKLDAEKVPAWDIEKKIFTIREQYVFQAEKPLLKYRLVQGQKYDLDSNGVLEEFSLKDGKVSVTSDSRIIWQSPDEWWVDYFFLGDANNDGITEFNLLVWKEGSFGYDKPFWLEEEDTSVKNHLFIFKLEKGSIKPVWQSSNLDHPIYRAALLDLNNDGENELVVNEGSYTDPARKEGTLWKWNGWGFSRISLNSDS